MWFIQPKQDYIPEIPWKHADEPAVMAWQIRARNYNTTPDNLALIPMSLIAFGGGYVMSLLVQSLLGSFLLGGGLFLLLMLIFMSVTHNTTIIVYRFTETLAEEYSWKPQEAAAASFLKWSAIILLPIVGVLILMDPSLVIAGIGPLGMGLMAWMMGSQQAKHNKSQHKEIEWMDAEEIVAWRKRNLIGLRFTDIHEDGIETFFYSTVYCQPHNFDENIQYLRKALPNVPYHERELKVFSNYAL
ncbi:MULTISPECIES: hypothetical protein [unclassified Halomonas]|uniref:hypothetical protein n=1 Tax=unclassified Halomonas TaxID=2609666 RepID=UPI0007D98459|nr:MULTISPECIES: hypothetical protein [unclassified Halomonas]MBT2787154.1 hypothetical protein [Halomonas sp. ISL-106]MBT2795496.1 hypothetical protein [Halomonas sp. ISL-104]OAL57993.1 hypothetical protein A6R74_11400 [Halomonas sp. ALS9]